MATIRDKVLKHKASRRKELPFHEKLVIVEQLNSLARAKRSGQIIIKKSAPVEKRRS